MAKWSSHTITRRRTNSHTSWDVSSEQPFNNRRLCGSRNAYKRRKLGSSATLETLNFVLRGRITESNNESTRTNGEKCMRYSDDLEAAWWDFGIEPGTDPESMATNHAICNICYWSGLEFIGPYHTEMATCPRCGSIARDRFLLFCFFTRREYVKNLRLLETSPRMGEGYRSMMRQYFNYTASDFDLSAHEGDIQINLQNIDLPDSSIDILLTPHVLEHVPDTEKALNEIFRVLTPGGSMYLQVPLLFGTTQVPPAPKFHADNTPVFFDFGWDLTDQIRNAGFVSSLLVTHDYFDILRGAVPALVSNGDGFNVEELIAKVRIGDLSPVADNNVAKKFGFLPAYHYATWECIKPG